MPCRSAPLPPILRNPVDLLHFIEMKPFSKTWAALRLGDEVLHALQTKITVDPKLPPVVPETGGLRKMRFSPESWNVGKSGALRVCYVYFEEFQIVLLALVYPKAERLDLTPEEKKALRNLIERQWDAFSRGRYN